MPTAQGHLTVRRRPINGTDGVAYNLRLSSNQAMYNPVDNTMTYGTITLQVTRSEGESIETITTAAEAQKYGLTLYVVSDTGTLWTYPDLMSLAIRTINITHVLSLGAIGYGVGTSAVNVRSYEKFSLSLRVDGVEIDRQYINVVADAQGVADGVSEAGIDMANGTINLYAQFVNFSVSKDGTTVAQFRLFDDQGFLNIGVINAEELQAGSILCNQKDSVKKYPSYSKYTTAINRHGDGVIEIFHPFQYINQNRELTENVALKIGVETITIDGTNYTTLIQYYNNKGQLKGALTTEGWVTPTSYTYKEIEVAVNADGDYISEAEAKSTTTYDSKTLYQISSTDDKNGMLATATNTGSIIKASSGTLMLWNPRCQIARISVDTSEVPTQAVAVRTHSRKRYSIDTSGNVIVDSPIF
jgi:hypothetical protein